jgi:hypothetical protein
MPTIVTRTNLATPQPTMLLYAALSPFGMTDDRKITANALFATITQNISDISLGFQDGAAIATVSAAGLGKLRYNDTTKTFQFSADGAAYAEFGSVPGSPANSVQFNNGGAFGGAAGFEYDSASLRTSISQTNAGDATTAQRALTVVNATNASVTFPAFTLVSGVAVDAIINSPGKSLFAASGVFAHLDVSAITSLTLAHGINAIVEQNGGTTISTIGVNSESYVYAGATATNLEGVRATSSLYGTATTLYGHTAFVYLDAGAILSSGNAFGFISFDPVATVGGVAPANYYHFYGEGNYLSYFGGDVEITGKLTVGGAIDPISLRLSGSTDLFLESANGSGAAVSAPDEGRIRYNSSTQTWQASMNGAAYVDFATGSGGMSIGGTVTSGTTGSVLFIGAGPALTQDNANLFWDDTNNRLGIGTAAPTDKLHLAASSGSVTVLADDSATNQYAQFSAKSNTRRYNIGVGGNGTGQNGKLFFYDATAGGFRGFLDSTGRWAINLDPFQTPNSMLQIQANNTGIPALYVSTSGIGGSNSYLAQYIHSANASTTVFGHSLFAGTGGNVDTGFGQRFLLQLAVQGFSGVLTDTGGFVWQWTNAGAQTSAIIIEARTNGGAIAEVVRFGGGTGFVATPPIRTSGSPTHIRFVTPADTTLTASTASIFAQYGGNSSAGTVTRQWATGAIATQRENVFVAPTYGFVGASTITTAVTLFAASPIAGANATLTSSYAAKFDASAVGHTALCANAAASPTADIFRATINNVLTAGAYAGISAGGYLFDVGSKVVSTQFDTTSTTLADITGLSVNVVAGKKYRFEAILYTTSDVADGVKFAISGTTTATAIVYEAVVNQGGVDVATVTQRATALDTAVGEFTAVTTAYVRITGTITVNAAGTLTVQAAQNVSAAGTTSVLVGSTWSVQEIPT